MEGWIKIDRSLQKHWIWEDPETLRAWVAVIMNVNWKPGKRLIRGRLVEYDRGQSVRSLESWGELFGGWSKKRVQRFFDVLRKDGMIDTESVTVTTRLTVRNYDKYQDSCHGYVHDSDTVATPQTTRTRPTDKESKKEKESKKYTGQFEEFWKAYAGARKGSKWRAFRRFEESLRVVSFDSIMKGLELYKGTQKWRDGFNPEACNWLRDRGWEVEPETQQQSNPINGVEGRMRHLGKLIYEREPIDLPTAAETISACVEDRVPLLPIVRDWIQKESEAGRIQVERGKIVGWNQ